MKPNNKPEEVEAKVKSEEDTEKECQAESLVVKKSRQDA